MTTGDEQAQGLVGNLFREVENQFNDLEREYSQARKDLALAGTGSHDTASDALQSSAERFELMSLAATLRAEVSRQADELDERDRLLNELGDKVIGFESEIVQRDRALAELHGAKQEALDERRKQSRLSALLDARAAERQALADVANRLQNERDHVQELLTTALVRFDEAETQLVQMNDKVRHLEAASQTSGHEHDARDQELTESRAEMSNLAEQIDDLRHAMTAADARAERAEALAERRSNEAGYLKRCLDLVNDKLETAGSFENDATALRRELTMAERRIAELERGLANSESELLGAKAAVDAIAERTSDYEELTVKAARLEQERDKALATASGRGVEAQAAVHIEHELVAPSSHAASLAERARELSARRSNEAAYAAQAAEEAAAHTVAAATGGSDGDAGAELHDLEDADIEVIEADLTAIDGDEDSDRVAGTVDPRDPLAESEIPVVESGGNEAASDIVVPRVPVPEPESEAVAPVHETAEIRVVTIAPDEISLASNEELLPVVSNVRKRTTLPARLVPNTPEAVAFLLNQPGVTAIVDARSTCSRTGIRPSELFDRLAALRDHFDVPVEVVVTPVSTPVGGAPDLLAIGVHHVTGADTVADRIRALCMGLPADQPLVVIAGDDHVRRAAIGEEANVVEPSAVLNTAAE